MTTMDIDPITIDEMTDVIFDLESPHVVIPEGELIPKLPFKNFLEVIRADLYDREWGWVVHVCISKR